MHRYADRRAAGRALAPVLRGYSHRGDVTVLALPRGGVPVGFELAQALGVELDVFLVRKIGAPSQPELALGAIASGGIRVINRKILAQLGVEERELESSIGRETEELARREALYRSNRPRLELAGRTVILVDDGLATGASMVAAVEAVRAQGVAKVVVAVPVAPPESITRLRSVADEVVCLQSPDSFSAVGEWFEDFVQTTDAEVAQLLAASQHPR